MGPINILSGLLLAGGISGWTRILDSSSAPHGSICFIFNRVILEWYGQLPTDL